MEYVKDSSQMRIRVGGLGADIGGMGNRPIQAALDYLAWILHEACGFVQYPTGFNVKERIKEGADRL